MTPTDNEIHIPPLSGARHEAWTALLEIADELPKTWVLVGGQMVMVHALHVPASSQFSLGAQSSPRVSHDVDIVMDLRTERNGLSQAHNVLTSHGFRQEVSIITGVGHRYLRGEASIDLLGPDGLGPRTNMKLGVARTLQSVGGSRALARAVQANIVYGSQQAVIGIPSVVGAVVSKSAILYAGDPSGHERHLADLETLIPLITRPHGLTDDAPLSRSERKLFRRLSSDRRLDTDMRQIVARHLNANLPNGTST